MKSHVYLGLRQGREKIEIKMGILVGLFVVSSYIVVPLVPHHVRACIQQNGLKEIVGAH